MHHSRDQMQSGTARKFIEEVQKETPAKPLGATGEFPEGKIDPNDEGEIQFAVGTHEGKVILNFNTPVKWVGMTPQQARALAEILRQKSYVARDEA